MNYICKLVKGYFIAFIIFLLATFFITGLIKFTSVSEAYSFYYLLAALSVATLFLGVFSGNLIGRNGLICAAGFSLIFVFLVVFGACCAYFEQISKDTFDLRYIIPVLIGAVGGIIGVNVKK